MLLYKYVSNAVLDQIISSNSVRFSTPDVLNDAFELTYTFVLIEHGSAASLVARALAMQMTKNKEYDELLKTLSSDLNLDYARLNHYILHRAADLLSSTGEIRTDKPNASHIAIDDGQESNRSIVESWETLYREIRNSHCVFCLTDDPCSLLMWAHYANSGQGAVIEFDLNLLVASMAAESNPAIYWGKVEYTNRRPMGDFAHVFASIFFKKPIEWSYEREWRIVTDIKHPNLRKLDVGKSTFLLAALPDNCIRRIICGPGTSTNDRAHASELAAQIQVPCDQAIIEDTEYSVSIHSWK